ncbi:MAG: glycosyltransferase [Candidatus Bathyarchaeales archaeon]
MVTIGVCVRNCTSTIRRAVESIMAQDYPHKLMEVIFVDDGSKDNTLSIINEYVSQMDMKVKVFHHEWKGLGYSRNVVVQNACGKYIIWVDGDMILPKDHVRLQVTFMEKNPEVGIGKAKYGVYSTKNLFAFLENLAAVVEFSSDDWKISDYKPLGTGGSIYRVDAVREVNGFNVKIKGVGEDMDLEFRVKNAGWLLAVTPALFYEIRRESWKDLWNEYFWHGAGGKYILKCMTHSQSVLSKMFPPFAILILFKHSILAYKLTNRKRVFLLPLHWIFKRAAWLAGFTFSCLKETRIVNKI